MAYVPVPMGLLQGGEFTSGRVLKAYLGGTSTVTPMYTDYTGGTSSNTVLYDANDLPTISGSVVFPHIDTTVAPRIKYVLYPDAASASSDTGALQTWDNIDSTNLTAINGALNVLHYGAKGDGVTDDLAAFDAIVVDAAAQNKAVYIPQPSVYYNLSNAWNINQSSLRVFGDGVLSAIVSHNVAAADVITVTADHVSISDIGISGLTGGGHGLHINTSGAVGQCSFSNIWIGWVDGDGVRVTQGQSNTFVEVKCDQNSGYRPITLTSGVEGNIDSGFNVMPHAAGNTNNQVFINCVSNGAAGSASNDYLLRIGDSGADRPESCYWYAGLIQGSYRCVYLGGLDNHVTSHIEPPTVTLGTHDGSNNAAILTDSGENWAVNEFVGFELTNTTDGSRGIVTSNTATTVTATLTGGTDNDWDTGDSWRLASQDYTAVFENCVSCTIDNSVVAGDIRMINATNCGLNVVRGCGLDYVSGSNCFWHEGQYANILTGPVDGLIKDQVGDLDIKNVYNTSNTKYNASNVIPSIGDPYFASNFSQWFDSDGAGTLLPHGFNSNSAVTRTAVTFYSSPYAASVTPASDLANALNFNLPSWANNKRVYVEAWVYNVTTSGGGYIIGNTSSMTVGQQSFLNDKWEKMRVTFVMDGGTSPAIKFTGLSGVTSYWDDIKIWIEDSPTEEERGYVDVTLACTTGSITIDAAAHHRLQYTRDRRSRMVHYEGFLGVDSVSTPTGTLKIQGLAHTAAAAIGSRRDYWNIQPVLVNSVGIAPTYGRVQPGTTEIEVYKVSAGNLADCAADITASAEIYVNISFLTD